MTIQQTEQTVPTRDALKVQAITQRIAEIVAQYEERNADLRAEATLTIGELNQRIQSLSSELQAAQAQIEYLSSPAEPEQVPAEETVPVDEVPQKSTRRK
jgi:uncharacterized small protein (DUF1192 family)